MILGGCPDIYIYHLKMNSLPFRGQGGIEDPGIHINLLRFESPLNRFGMKIWLVVAAKLRNYLAKSPLHLTCELGVITTYNI